jgi:hypothetical protein
MKRIAIFFSIILLAFTQKNAETKAWIRINQLGYQPNGVKVAVWCSKDSVQLKIFQLVDANTKKIVLTDSTKKSIW